MATQNISININLNGLRGELQNSIQKTICLIAAGLKAKIEVEPEELILPVTMHATFGKLGLSKDQFENEYSKWILSNGFRDAIESVSSFLESVHRVLSIWELMKMQEMGQTISGEIFNSIFLDGGNKFHRLGLPDKLDYIERVHNIEIGNSFKEQILSINIARNCFVHRRGIVSDRDINDQENLRVKWSRLKPILKNEDCEQELVLGQIVEKESTLCVRFEENEKIFKKGETLEFSVEEISEIFWCFFLFGNNLVMNINKFGRSCGYIPSEE